MAITKVTSRVLEDNSVGVAQLSAGAVTPTKLSTGAPFWDSSGNVGINVTNPQRRLQSTVSANAAAAQSAKTGLLIQNLDATGTSNAPNTGVIQFAFDPANPRAYIEGGTFGNDLLAFGIGGAEYMRISANGNVGIGTGTTTPVTTLQIDSTQPSSTSWPNRGGLIVRGQGTDIGGRVVARSAGDVEVPLFFGVRTRGTLAAPTAILANDNIAGFGGVGYDGTNWASAGAFRVLASENWTTTNTTRNGYLTLNTTTDGVETEKVRITSSGNVGIGTTNPTTSLTVESAGTTYTTPVNNNLATIRATNTTNNNTNAHAILSLNTTGAGGGNPFISFDVSGVAGWSAGIDNADSDKFKIASWWSNIATNTRFTIDQSGNVGIGTTSPTEKLTVDGGARIQRSTDPYINFFSSTTQTGRIVSSAGTDGDFNILGGRGLYLYSGGTTSPTGFAVFGPNGGLNIGYSATNIYDIPTNGLIASGNVGIGTPGPGTRLDVNGRVRVQNGNLTGYGFLEFGQSATASNNWHIGSEGDGTLRFYNGNFGSGTERVRVTSAGNVGIGTNNPQQALHVQGNVRVGDATLSQPSGNAPMFACRAWCKFDGTGPNGAKTFYGGNISTVTKSNPNQYTIVFATAMPSEHYAVAVSVKHLENVTRSVNVDISSQTANGFIITPGYGSTSYSSESIQFAVFC